MDLRVLFLGATRHEEANLSIWGRTAACCNAGIRYQKLAFVAKEGCTDLLFWRGEAGQVPPITQPSESHGGFAKNNSQFRKRRENSASDVPCAVAQASPTETKL